jgi:hypothetical protein
VAFTPFAQKLTKMFVRNGLAVVATCLGMIFAGSGDLDTLKHIIRMYAMVEKEASYGIHMAFQMSLGMLFLGNGTMSLGRTPVCIASLFLSFFPLFPTQPGDHRLHVQAFRHFWVLAVEDRCLVTADVETQQLVRVPVEIQSSGGPMQVFTPCVLPHLDTITSIRVSGPRYWNIEIPVSKAGWVHVQRKLQYLSYLEDPDGRRCFTSSFPHTGTHTDQFIQAYSSSPHISSLLKHLCSSPSQPISQFCKRIVVECVSQDKLEMVPLYIWLYHTVHRIVDGKGTVDDVTSVACMIEFVKSNEDACFLLDRRYMDLVTHQLHEYFTSLETSTLKEELAMYQRGLGVSPTTLLYIEFYRIPKTLRRTMEGCAAVQAILAKFQYPQVPIPTLQKLFEWNIVQQ